MEKKVVVPPAAAGLRIFYIYFFYESLCIMQRHTNSRMLIQMCIQSITSTLQKKWYSVVLKCRKSSTINSF